MATEEPDVWEIRLSGSERGRSSTEVWMRYCGTVAKADGKRRTQTSSCSSGDSCLLEGNLVMVACLGGARESG